MTVKNPKNLVIDASIARAAGGKEAIYPKSKQCRDFLATVRSDGHQIVMTPDVRDEWNRHQSEFAMSWRTKMVSRRQIVFLKAQDVEDHELREELTEHANQDSPSEAMLKDVHLLEAALATHKIVAADDRKVRRYFHNMCEFISKIRDVIWVNPTIEDEDCIKWLHSSAPAEVHRRLGFKSE